MPIDHQKLTELGRTYISETEPSGVSVRYEPDFQALEAEVSKLESLSGEAVDWNVVLSLCVTILSEQSKDILVACYLSQSLLKVEGIAGFAVGLSILVELVEHHWQTAFPPLKRMRARSSALQWLSEQSANELLNVDVTESTAKDYLSAAGALSSLISGIDAKVDSDTPSMLELHKLLKQAKLAASGFSLPEANEENTFKASDVKTSEIPASIVEPKQEHTSADSGLSGNIDPTDNDTRSVVSGHTMATLGVSPISDDSDCGIAVKYEPDFEALEAELAKQEALTASTVDWKEVCHLASCILKDQSKDLLVSAYLSKGLLETQGYLGLTVALTITRDLIKTHWQGLYPPKKRMRARESALQWLSEKCGLYISSNEPTEKDFDAVIESAGLVTDILDLLDQHIEGGGPSLLELSRPLKEYKRAAKHAVEAAAKSQSPPQSVKQSVEPKKEPVNKEQKIIPVKSSNRSSKAAKPADISSNIEAGPVANPNEAKKALRSIQEATRKVAGFNMDASLRDAKAYRLNRLSTWLMIDVIPPSVDQITQLMPPQAAKQKQLQALFEANNYNELLPALELTLSRSAFWFDGQCMAARALKALGDGYTEAYETVVRELRGFLERIPGVENLKYSDGTEFACAQTQLWIQSDVKSSAASGDEVSEGETPWAEIQEEAKTLLAGGNLQEAVALFQKGINSAPTERLSWQWRFALAQVLQQAGKVELVVPMLKSLLEEIDNKGLISWDGQLAKSVAVLLYKSALNMANKDNQSNHVSLLAAQEYAFAQLCNIDPITAIKLQEK